MTPPAQPRLAEMTPEAKRIAIAEARGYRRCYPNNPVDANVWQKPGTDGSNLIRHYDISSTLPDYLNDLNAMHEAEKGLTEEEASGYHNAIESISTAKALAGEAQCAVEYYLLHATAAKRADAFLLTKHIATL